MTTPVRTARRNLAQRIDSMLRKVVAGALEPTDWQLDQVEAAIAALEEERFAEGERTMSRAELPKLYEPAGYVRSGQGDWRRLADRLQAVVEEAAAF